MRRRCCYYYWALKLMYNFFLKLFWRWRVFQWHTYKQFFSNYKAIIMVNADDSEHHSIMTRSDPLIMQLSSLHRRDNCKKIFNKKYVNFILEWDKLVFGVSWWARFFFATFLSQLIFKTWKIYCFINLYENCYWRFYVIFNNEKIFKNCCKNREKVFKKKYQQSHKKNA
jgi:hypothetical protein